MKPNTHTTRKPLTGVFPGVDIPYSSSRSPSPPKRDSGISFGSAQYRLSMANSIRAFMARKSTEELGRQPINTVKMAKWLKDESKRLGLVATSTPLVLPSVWLSMKTRPEEIDDMALGLEDDLVRVIYGSNAIELAGTSWDATLQLCKSVFNGQTTGEFEERSREYAKGLKEFLSSNDEQPEALAIRTCREVIQHAQALMYMVENLVFQDKDLTENLITTTHAILYKGLERNDEEEAGKYRQHPCAARLDEKRKSVFIRPSAIAPEMEALVLRYQEDINRAKNSGSIDPYELAGRVAHKFINIHPFSDGNGRMKRIILNAILLKYAGHVAPFGGEPGDRDEYLELAHRSSKKYHKEEGEVDEDDWSGHHELVRHVINHSIGKIQNWLSTSFGHSFR